MENSFDVIVVGSGPGGYVCAIRAAQLGLKTALVEKDATLGGTCLNVGCIPSKALLHSTELFHFAKHGAEEHGFRGGDQLEIDIPALMKKKSAVVSKLVGGVEILVKQRKIEILKGVGKLLGDGQVEVSGEESRTVNAKHIILASGSQSVELPFLPFDGERVVSSTEAIALESVPKSLVVVGGGAIGLELGSVWARLGTKVTVLEFLPEIAATFDSDVSKMALRIFKKQGLEIHTETKVTGYDAGKQIVTAEQKDETVEFPAEKVLVSVGRKPYTEELGLEAAGVETDDKGRIKTDEQFRTTAAGVYAIGDVIDGPMLAHKAEEEGVACAELIAGKAGHVNYDIIPNVIYTEPEIASVGIGEKEARERGVAYRVGKFPLAANGRALATDATDGFIKVIAEEKSDRLLGIQIIARNASEVIAAAVTHMEYGGSAEDIARTIHAHPTLSEALKEAALAVDGRAIHTA